MPDHTDCSATLNDGAGMVVTGGDPANSTSLLTKQRREAAFTLLNNEEKVAMHMALKWILSRPRSYKMKPELLR